MNKNTPIPLYLVSGFLGSGKSTFLKNIIDTLGDSIRIGIIQNEYSSVNIDSLLLAESKRPYILLDVNKGSIFCLCLFSDFIDSLVKFIDKYHPEVLFIEATGLSDPMAILTMINAPQLVEKVRFSRAYTVVDGSLFTRQLKILKSVTNQIKIADIVLINKKDMISEEKAAEVALLVSQYNPFCNVLYTSFSQLPESEFQLIKNSSSIAQSTFNIDAGEYELISSPPDIKVETISTPRRISEEKTDQLELYLKSFIRAKGFVRLSNGKNVIVQAVSGIVSVREYKLPLLRSEIVFFGDGADISNIKKLFKS